MSTRLRACGNPDCRICRWNDERHQDSGHGEERSDTLAGAFIGMAAIVVLFFVLFVLIPVMA